MDLVQAHQFTSVKSQVIQKQRNDPCIAYEATGKLLHLKFLHTISIDTLLPGQQSFYLNWHVKADQSGGVHAD